MPKQIRTTVYTFAELQERAKREQMPEARAAHAQRVREIEARYALLLDGLKPGQDRYHQLCYRRTCEIDRLNKTTTAAAKDRALEWMAERARDSFEDFLCDDLEPGGHYAEVLAGMGFLNAKIQYRGFCSQGDGASFTADVDLAKMLEATGPEARADAIPWEGFVPTNRGDTAEVLARSAVWAHVARGDSREVHKHSCHVNVTVEAKDGAGDARTDAQLADDEKCLAAFIEDLRLEACNWIYRALESSYRDCQSEDTCAENAEANEWTFTADGERFG